MANGRQTLPLPSETHEPRTELIFQETPAKPDVTLASRLVLMERESTTIFQLLSTVKFQYRK